MICHCCVPTVQLIVSFEGHHSLKDALTRVVHPCRAIYITHPVYCVPGRCLVGRFSVSQTNVCRMWSIPLGRCELASFCRVSPCLKLRQNVIDLLLASVQSIDCQLQLCFTSLASVKHGVGYDDKHASQKGSDNACYDRG